VYTVSGAHTYAEEGSYAITIDVADVLDGGTSTTTITGTATVSDAALTAGTLEVYSSGVEIGRASCREGVTFTDATPGEDRSDMTETTHYGDVRCLEFRGVLCRSVYTVSGAHTYAEEGSYAITIDVADVLDGGTSTTTITGTATVSDAALTAGTLEVYSSGV